MQDRQHLTLLENEPTKPSIEGLEKTQHPSTDRTFHRRGKRRGEEASWYGPTYPATMRLLDEGRVLLASQLNPFRSRLLNFAARRARARRSDAGNDRIPFTRLTLLQTHTEPTSIDRHAPSSRTDGGRLADGHRSIHQAPCAASEERLDRPACRTPSHPAEAGWRAFRPLAWCMGTPSVECSSTQVCFGPEFRA